MPVPNDHLRYTIKGAGPGSEIWQTGIWASAGGMITSAADLATAVASQLAGVITWFSAIADQIWPTYSLVALRGDYYESGGDTATFSAETATSGHVGTLTGSGGCPIDTCIVMSTRTGLAGAHHRGRMYVPFHEPTITSAGQLDPGRVTTYVSATAALLSDINSSFATVVVVSRSLGSSAPVTAVSADHKPDVQRRRQNRLTGGALATSAVTPH